MAKKKKETHVETNGDTTAAALEEAPVRQEAAPTVTEGPPEQPQEKGNGPVETFSVPVSRDTFVQASVWARVVTLKGGEQFTTHEVSFRKRYKDGEGQWQSAHSFRGSELYALAYVLRRAEDYILGLRTSTKDGTPF